MYSRFPTYKNAEVAARWGCYLCCKPLNAADVQDSRYPPGRGQWAIQCRHCQSWTWFDLEKETANA